MIWSDDCGGLEVCLKPRISLSFYTRPAWSLAASGKLKKTYNYTKITAIILRPHTSPAGIPTQEIYLGSRCTAPYRLEWTFPHIGTEGGAGLRRHRGGGVVFSFEVS